MVARGGAVRQLADELLELLLPQRCVACGRFGAALHEACLKRLSRAEGARCFVCWAKLTRAGAPCAQCERARRGGSTLDGRRAAFTFTGDARRAILEAKFRGVSALLSPLGVAAAGVVPRVWEIDVVVPVPLHAARARHRGFNQSEVAGRAVAHALGRPLEARMLRRGRSTAAQAGLEAAARAANVEGAFELADGVEIAGRSVLVVDDVTTTGATLEAAAAALRLGGARRVYALALAIED